MTEDQLADRRFGPKISRRAVLALLGSGGFAAVAGASIQQSGGGSGALGGAGPDQDRVPVYDLLTILGGEVHELGGTESYNGIDWREGGSLTWKEGATFHFEEST